MSAVLWFKALKLGILLVGLALERYQVPFFRDVRRQVQLNILMAVLHGALVNENVWNPALGLVLVGLLEHMFPHGVVWRHGSLSSKLAPRANGAAAASRTYVAAWFALYYVWNMMFARDVSGTPAAFAHNTAPLLFVAARLAQPHTNPRWSPAWHMFYMWAVVRAISIMVVELDFLADVAVSA